MSMEYPFDGVRATFSAFPRGTSDISLVRGSSLSSGNGMDMSLLKGQPRLYLKDAKGTSMVLGHEELEKTATGSVEQRPAASIVLLDKDGKVIWKTP